ncbi:hypothetical protein D3C71_1045630 [compost metagenome]
MGVQCTQAQAQDRLLWNDVCCFPGLQRADRDHRRLLCIDVARDHGLQSHDHARRRHQRINRQMRHRAVTAHAFDGHCEQVLRSHHRPFAKAQMPRRQTRHVVHAEQRIAGKTFEQAIGEHRFRAALAFFGGLENQGQGAVELAGRRQVARRAQQHRGVAVMPAGVHAALVLTAVGCAGVFDDRQCIHVCPYPELARAAAIAQDADHAGLADPGVHLVAPIRQGFGHQRRGAVFLEAEFRVGVDVLAGGVQVAGHVVEPGKDVLMSGHDNFLRPGDFPFLLFVVISRHQRQVALTAR